jgi:hypothetical protein
MACFEQRVAPESEAELDLVNQQLAERVRD